jgi:hypothetical protein
LDFRHVAKLDQRLVAFDLVRLAAGHINVSGSPSIPTSFSLFLHPFMLSLFDREDGKAADWPLIAETLLREAFYALDQAPNGPARCAAAAGDSSRLL